MSIKYPAYGGSSYYRKSYGNNFTTHVSNPSNIVTIDEELVKTLLSIVSPSYSEDPMRNYLIDFIDTNIPDAVMEKDQHGNLYITKTKKDNPPSFYPCIVAHMDEVITDIPEREIVKVANFFIGISRVNGDKAGTGGDDKCGIYVCLEMLRLMDHVKVAFFIAEEVGGVGSNCCDMDFFTDCRFVLQPDRYGNSSVITRTNGMEVTTPEFEDDLSDLMATFNYQCDNGGTFTDIGVLAKRGLELAVSNISCGYYDQHTEEEVVCIPDLENCLNFIYRIFTDLPDKQYYRKYEVTPLYGYTQTGNHRIYDEWEDYEDWESYKKSWKTTEDAPATKALPPSQSPSSDLEKAIQEAYALEKEGLSQEERDFDIQYINLSTANDIHTLDDDSLTYFMKYYPDEIKRKIGTLVYNTLERRLLAY